MSNFNLQDKESFIWRVILRYASQVLALKETLGMDPTVIRAQTVASTSSALRPPQDTQSQAPAASQMPSGFQMAAPLNEAELTALLMASPLYQKMEQIKQAVAKGAVAGSGGKTLKDGEHIESV